jgi:hypothetical protein
MVKAIILFPLSYINIGMQRAIVKSKIKVTSKGSKNLKREFE